MQCKVVNIDLSRFLLPFACAFCGIELERGSLCAPCEASLPWIARACDRCARPLPAPGEAFCPDCQIELPPFAKAVARLCYAFPIDAALKALKFQRRLYYAPALAELLLPPLAESFADVDALLPVPLHPIRHAIRGFNQSAELCRPLRKCSGLPVIRNVRRIRHTRPQTGLDGPARRRNMKAAFKVRGALRYRYPLIVDDVVTTGETCRQLASALLAAGAVKVGVLAVARATAKFR